MKHAAAVALGSSPIVTLGALHVLGNAQPPHWSVQANEFLTLAFWLTILVALAGGAFGGISYEVLLRGGAIELPHRVRADNPGRAYTHAPAENLIALGIVGRALVGAAAAMTVLLVIEPGNGHLSIALSVTSGAAAPAVIRLMRRQLLAAANAFSRRADDPRASQARADAGPRQPSAQTAYS
jgi:hypothetical protein